MYKTLYFCFAGAILLFSVIVVNIAPAINHLAEEFDEWPSLSCSLFNDKYKYAEKRTYASKEAKDETLEPIKKLKNRCERRKAMVGLEYTALNINLVCGFICTLLGFFHFFNIGDMGKIPSFAGLGTGIVGFVLTLVYVIESGLVFNDIDREFDSSGSIRIDSDGSYLKWDNSRDSYVCTFYDKDNEDSLYLKYSDYGNKFLNYNKDVIFREQEKKYEYFTRGGCNYQSLTSDVLFYKCKEFDEQHTLKKQKYYDEENKEIGECNKLFYINPETDNYKKRLYDHWLTTIILSCFIFLFDIALALFGFLLMSNSNKGL